MNIPGSFYGPINCLVSKVSFPQLVSLPHLFQAVPKIKLLLHLTHSTLQRYQHGQTKCFFSSVHARYRVFSTGTTHVVIFKLLVADTVI